MLDISGTYASTLGQNNPIRYRGYYYDSETSLYYLNSRYYDPAMRRFINADDIDCLGINREFVSFDLFSYCGNNPVTRKDEDGEFWLTTVVIGLGKKYVSDVINNAISGKKGIEMFKPRSSFGSYIAAGVTALIPGVGFGSALIRNAVSEGIVAIEKSIKGESVNFFESIVNVGVGTVLDVTFEKVSDKVTNFISSKEPTNYSSYANKARSSNPNLTRQQIYKKMGRAIKLNRAISDTFSAGIDIARSILPK